MARPTKNASVLLERSEDKAVKTARMEREEQLKGKNGALLPPKHLTDRQKTLFKTIVDELSTANILCKLDTWILEQCVIAIDSLQRIEMKMNESDEMMIDPQLLSAYDRYSKTFARYCNELSLSPQSRAKIANINVQKDESTEMLKKILAGEME